MENLAQKPYRGQWFYIPIEWLQGWQFHQVYYLQYLRRIARPNGHFCHSNGRGTQAAALKWSDPVDGRRHGLRRSQMFVARAFLRDAGLIHLFPSKFGTVGKLNLAALEKMECAAVRADVLARITTPAAWVETRLQILLAWETAQAERERGHTQPRGRRPCLGVREFKSRLDVVPHWKYLAPVLHAPAALGALFPPWQALALARPCTMPDRGGGGKAPKPPDLGPGPCTMPDIEGTGIGILTIPGVRGRASTAQEWRIPWPVMRHIRTELKALCLEEGIQPGGLGNCSAALAAANLQHRKSGGAALGGYRHILMEALGALYFVREVAARKTRVSEMAHVLDQMRRFHCRGYWETWKAEIMLREAMEFEARGGAAAAAPDAPDDLAAWVLESR